MPTCQQRAHSSAEDGVDEDGSDVLEEDTLRLHVVSRLEHDRRQQQHARLGVEYSRLSLHQPHRRHPRTHGPDQHTGDDSEDDHDSLVAQTVDVPVLQPRPYHTAASASGTARRTRSVGMAVLPPDHSGTVSMVKR